MKNDKGGFHLISTYRGAIMGIAAVLILIFHEWEYLFENVSGVGFVEEFIRRNGFYGVDIFLLLSGMGLVYAIEKESVGVFYRKRFLRLLVPYLFIGIIRFLIEKWPITVFLTHISGYDFYAVDMYSFLWFVPAIATLYLLFPLYCMLMKKSGNACAFTGAVIIVWLFASICLSDVLRIDLYGFTNRIPIFVIGVLIGWTQKRQDDNFAGIHWVMLGLMFVLGLYLAYLTGYRDMPLLVPVQDVFLPGVLIAFSGSLLLGKIFDLLSKGGVGRAVVKVFAFIGTFSLELYCVQEWLGGLIRNRFYNLSGALSNIVVFAASFAAAYLIKLLENLMFSRRRKNEG